MRSTQWRLQKVQPLVMLSSGKKCGCALLTNICKRMGAVLHALPRSRQPLLWRTMIHPAWGAMLPHAAPPRLHTHRTHPAHQMLAANVTDNVHIDCDVLVGVSSLVCVVYLLCCLGHVGRCLHGAVGVVPPEDPVRRQRLRHSPHRPPAYGNTGANKQGRMRIPVSQDR